MASKNARFASPLSIDWRAHGPRANRTFRAGGGHYQQQEREVPTHKPLCLVQVRVVHEASYKAEDSGSEKNAREQPSEEEDYPGPSPHRPLPYAMDATTARETAIWAAAITRDAGWNCTVVTTSPILCGVASSMRRNARACIRTPKSPKTAV